MTVITCYCDHCFSLIENDYNVRRKGGAELELCPQCAIDFDEDIKVLISKTIELEKEFNEKWKKRELN